MLDLSLTVIQIGLEPRLSFVVMLSNSKSGGGFV